MDGVDLIVPLRAQGWTVLVITGATDLDRIAEAVAHGAANWVVKGANFPELLSTVAEMTAGGATCRLPSGGVHQALPGGDGDAPEGRRAAEVLSPREREVLGRLTEGATAGAIAAETHTSIRTVQTHIHRILTKLDVSSQLAATAIAFRHRRQPPPSSRVSGGRCAGSRETRPECRRHPRRHRLGQEGALRWPPVALGDLNPLLHATAPPGKNARLAAQTRHGIKATPPPMSRRRRVRSHDDRFVLSRQQPAVQGQGEGVSRGKHLSGPARRHFSGRGQRRLRGGMRNVSRLARPAGGDLGPTTRSGRCLRRLTGAPEAERAPWPPWSPYRSTNGWALA